jgi:uncharacterized protein YcaQ
VPPLEITQAAARRYILGRQGLWPGRRWRGLPGTDQAMRAMENVQLDPLNVMARAHDLMLQGRVLDYRPDDWAVLAYQRRRFFEWGGWLAVRPIEELPHWRVLMRRERDAPHWRAFAVEHAAAIEEMRAVLRERDAVSNRDFAMNTRTRVDSYRGRKDSAIALHYLWRIGEAMVTRRDGFERVYARTDAVVPAALSRESDDREADEFLLRKIVAAEGLTRFLGLNGLLQRTVGAAEIKRWRDERTATGDLIEVRVEGWKGSYWAPGGDRAVLDAIATDRIPEGWTPLDTTTDEEATFLSPLDPVSARGRARLVFDFEYKWEVYTPASKRRFGYYALPILWRDGLVARFDGRLDRTTDTLVLLGLWLEDGLLARDRAFADALSRAMARFCTFLGAARLDATALSPPLGRLVGGAIPGSGVRS